MPELTRPCNQTKCEFQWFTSQWSNCSVECGKGVQTRNVLCAQFDKDSVKPTADESKCTETKPESSKECDSEKECPGQWFTGPWSSCTKECGGGEKTRKVLCIANGESVPVTQCSEDTIAFSKDECNKSPCIEDEIIPVDTTSNPIEADDEGDEYCDDDEEENSLEVIDTTTVDSSSTTSDEFSSTGSESTESSLITDELMLSDSTGFETDSSSDSTTDIYCMCSAIHIYL